MTTLLTPAPRVPQLQSVESPARPERLQLQLLPSSARGPALEAWTRIEARLSHDPALACSTLWTRAWLQHYGDRVPHEFLIAHHRGEPVGAALLTRGVHKRNGPFPWRTRHIGCAGERHGESACVEYNQLLVDPKFRSPFEEEVIGHLLHDKSWDALCLDGFEANDAKRLLQDIPGAEVRLRPSPWHDLAAARRDGREVLDQLGRSTRQNTRRVLRKYGALDVEWAETAGQADDILSELIALHQARWAAAGEPGAFHSPRFTGFQRQLVHDTFAAAASGASSKIGTVLFRVRHQGETVGCLMLLADRGRLLDYVSGFASFEHKPSPGVVTHLLCMQEALRRGYDAYDFLVGDKRHKDNLSTHVNQLAWAAWSRPSIKTKTIAALRRLKQRFTPKP